MPKRKLQQDFRDLEMDRDIDAVLQIIDRTEEQQRAMLRRAEIPWEHRVERVRRLAGECLRSVRRILPSMVPGKK